MLANDVPVAEVGAHFGCLSEALERAGIAASLGHAATNTGLVTVEQAFAAADSAMYAAKRDRHAARLGRTS